MWPMLVDMCKDDCKRMLRRIELEAYSNIVTAFRAQGDLSKDKKKVLQDLCSILSISTERHRAEVRRAYNDERLATIADQITGSSYSSEWAIEGRRLIPLMPRLVPQTAFTALANKMATSTSFKKADCGSCTTLAPGTNAGNASVASVTSSMCPQTPPSQATKSGDDRVPVAKPPSPSCGGNTTLPVQVKGNTTENGNDDGINGSRKRKRCASLTSLPAKTPSPPGTSTNVSATAKTAMPPASSAIRTVSVPIGTSPVKITLTGPSHKSTTAVTTAPSQKVILVSTCSSLPSSILQRSVGVPIVRTVTATGTTPSVSASATSNLQQTKASTVSSTPIMHSPVSVTYTVGSPTASVVTPATSFGGANGHKSRAVSTLTGKNKVKQVGSVHSAVPLTATLPIQGSHQKPSTSVAKTAVLVKSEGAVKVASHTPSATSTKISPKLSHSSSSTGGTHAPVMVLTKSLTSASIPGTQTYGPRVVNVIAHSSPTCTSVSVSKVGTVSSLTGPLGAKVIKTAVIKRSNPTNPSPASNTNVVTQTSKPSTILIQKAHFVNTQMSNATVILATAPHVTSKGTEPVAAFQENRDTSSSEPSASLSPKNDATCEKKDHDPPSRCQQILKDVVAVPEDISSGTTNTVLADLLQAAGILPESSHDSSTEALALEEQRTDVATAPNTEPSSDWGNPTSEAVPITSSVASSSSPSLDEVKCSSVEKSTEPEKFPFITEPNLLQIDHVNLEESCVQQEQDLKQTATEELLCETPTTTEKVVTSLTSGLVCSKETASVSGREVLGELDPKTGIFYPYLSTSSSIPKIEPEQADESMDIFCTALATARLDLSPLKLSEEIQPKVELQRGEADLLLSSTSISDVVVVPENKIEHNDEADPRNPCTVSLDGTSEHKSNQEDKSAEEPGDAVIVEEQSYETVEQVAYADDVRDMKKEETTNDNAVVEQNSILVEECTVTDLVCESTDVPDDMMFSNVGTANEVVCQEVMITEEVVDDQTVTEETNAVKVDFESDSATASQSGDSTIGVTFGEESGETDSKRPKRKRRSQCVSSMDESLSVPHLSGWARSAMGLLLRVGKFRGSGRKPTDPGAAHWFLQPVTAEEAPEYQDIIKNPMDFSTIKKKLESSQYQDVSEFHSDMILVKENCELYNPADHFARKDCEEVFAFYQQEYDRLVEKWQKSHLFSPSPKKSKTTT